uniref:WD_REPEATS_REGION domain-containing protein n=1 Tax=Macrostomum lignano TaxID=282301 RepID=A0A1I8FN66_9PLAT
HADGPPPLPPATWSIRRPRGLRRLPRRPEWRPHLQRPLPARHSGGVKPMSNMRPAGKRTRTPGISSDHLRRQVNLDLGVNPQDVRFPVNIAELAFTANYFAARRTTAEKKTIEFDVDTGARHPLSYDNRDNLCVPSHHGQGRVYQTSLGEIVTTVTAFNNGFRLASLLCVQDSRKAHECWPAIDLHLLERAGDGAQQVIFLGITGFQQDGEIPQLPLELAYTILLISKVEGPDEISSTSGGVAVAPPRCSDNPNGKPLVFCSYDTANRKILNKFSKHNVQRSEHYSLSPDGKLLFVSSRTKCILVGYHHVEAAALAGAAAGGRPPRLQKSAGPSMTIEFYPNFESLSSLAIRAPSTCPSASSSTEGGQPHLPSGLPRRAVRLQHDTATEEGDQPKPLVQQLTSVVMSCCGPSGPEAYVHLVTEESWCTCSTCSTKAVLGRALHCFFRL